MWQYNSSSIWGHCGVPSHTYDACRHDLFGTKNSCKRHMAKHSSYIKYKINVPISVIKNYWYQIKCHKVYYISHFLDQNSKIWKITHCNRSKTYYWTLWRNLLGVSTPVEVDTGVSITLLFIFSCRTVCNTVTACVDRQAVAISRTLIVSNRAIVFATFPWKKIVIVVTSWQ